MSAAFLDSSALVKLVIKEAESGALVRFLSDRPLMTAAIARVETERAVARVRPGDDLARRSVRRLLERVHVIEQSAEIERRAAELQPPSLRSLDAVHLATAQLAGDLVEVLVGYDRQLLAAAEAAGICTARPV